jgi:acyl-coenzyme A synthetase/AMP-(fatty) acid ligase
VHFVEALPRNAVGKVVRRQIREFVLGTYAEGENSDDEQL